MATGWAVGTGRVVGTGGAGGNRKGGGNRRGGGILAPEMKDTDAVEFVEDRVPLDEIEETIDELVELYGGSITTEGERSRTLTLPLRRGAATGGAVECTLSWAADGDAGQGSVTMHCDRNVDAPKFQRVLLLVAGVVGAVFFMLWPFFPHEKEYGSLAWIGGVIAFAVYVMTLRKSSGGLACDFLKRLADRQRAIAEHEAPPLT